jgi:hypothetical protein
MFKFNISAMNVLKLLPVVLSFLLLGAHFYRAGLIPLTVLCAAILFLLFLKKRWIPRLLQVLLVVGAIEWLRTLYMFAAMRIAWDQPWGRLALILGGVALFTALSSLVFRNRKLRDYYQS